MDDFEVLGRLFSSRVRTKLLKFFLTMPESGYFIRELERKIGEDAKNISRELNNLENIGFLKGEKRGIQKFYSTKKDFLFYSELKSVFLKSSGREEIFRTSLIQLDGIEKVFMKELPSTENDKSAQIKLIFGLIFMAYISHCLRKEKSLQHFLGSVVYKIGMVNMTRKYEGGYYENYKQKVYAHFGSHPDCFWA